MHNKRLMCGLRSIGLLCSGYHKKFQLHSGAIARGYKGKSYQLN